MPSRKTVSGTSTSFYTFCRRVKWTEVGTRIPVKMPLGCGGPYCLRGYVKHIQIERKSKVLPADIAREHLSGVGKPVIITDATENWPARSKWTFEFLKTVYGPDLATAWLGIGLGPAKVTTLSAYINY